MGYLSRIVWFVPLFVHIAYILATYEHLPSALGPKGSAGIPVIWFYVGWTGMTVAANAAFVLLHIYLPKLKDKSLVVPEQTYWLSTKELRGELIERLRGICEAALLGLNVFFIAIYQMVYQTNAARTVIKVPLTALVSFFMALPLIVIVAAMLITIRGLAKDAAKNKKS